jgi:DnaJ-class molecular chaperone
MGMKRNNKIGSLFVLFEIDFPDKLENSQLEQIGEIL